MQKISHSSSGALALVVLVGSGVLTDCLNLRSRTSSLAVDRADLSTPPMPQRAHAMGPHASAVIVVPEVPPKALTCKTALECMQAKKVLTNQFCMANPSSPGCMRKCPPGGCGHGACVEGYCKCMPGFVGASCEAPVMLSPATGSVVGALAQTQSGPEKVPANVSYEVVKKSSIDRKATMDCLCKLGQFWHWRIKDCVEQGAWAYECGFFPPEHHDKVCIDGLKCQGLNGTEVTYGGFEGAKPASCQHCAKEDKCPTGEERHSKTCLKEYLLTGSACQTVRVTTSATASVKVTEKVTKSSVASATATASASQKATATEEVTAEKKAKAEGAEVAGSATKAATASATKEATAEGNVTVEAQGSGEGSAKAEATEEGSAEGKACVTVDEVKDFLELKNKQRFSAVLSAKIVSAGDELAFDKAYALALAAARKAGLLNAQEAAKALASAKAREHAGLEAKAAADEAAAWKAEAGAKKEAQDKAKAEALAKAQEAASQEAAEAAKKAAEAAAAAKAAAEAAAEAAANAAADKKAAAEAEAKAKADAAAKAQAAADAAAAAAAEAKAKQEAIDDYLTNQQPTQAPIEITTPELTNAPRKITAEQIRAKLP